VDVVLDFNGRLCPVEFKAASHLSGYDTRGIRAFHETHPQAAPGVVVYGGHKPYRVSEPIVAIPWTAV
jgi:hypothetical protein